MGLVVRLWVKLVGCMVVGGAGGMIVGGADGMVACGVGGKVVGGLKVWLLVGLVDCL